MQPRADWRGRRKPRKPNAKGWRDGFAAFGCLGLAAAMHAEGFRSPTIGTYGLSVSGGRTAFVEDASAVAHNPANIPILARWEVSIEPTFAHYAADYAGPGGRLDSTRDPWNVLPSLFVAGPVGAGRFGFGFGLTVPYGLAIKWDPNGAFRYFAPYSTKLSSLNFSPTAAFKLTDNLHLGAGLNVMWSELKFEQFYSWSAVVMPGLPDGVLEAKGDGVGVGATVGLTWQVLAKHRLAATVRIPMDVDYSGDASVSNVPTLGFGTLNTGFDSEIRYPTIVTLGYGFQVLPSLRLGADFEWLQFERFESLPIHLGQSPPGIPSSLPQDWKNTFTAGFGAAWQFARDWTLRGGYQHLKTPVPEYTFSPSIPDANQNVVTVGIGFRRGRHRAELAYAHVFYEDRDIRDNVQPAFLGRYSIDVNLVSVAYGFSF